jgi:hypothetical protein
MSKKLLQRGVMFYEAIYSPTQVLNSSQASGKTIVVCDDNGRIQALEVQHYDWVSIEPETLKENNFKILTNVMF